MLYITWVSIFTVLIGLKADGTIGVGGTDPSSFTHRIYQLSKKLHGEYRNIAFTFIVGIGYNCGESGVYKREQLHTFARMQNGFLNLGLGSGVLDDTIEKTFEWLVNKPQIKEEMRVLMLQHNSKRGIDREIKLILGE